MVGPVRADAGANGEHALWRLAEGDRDDPCSFSQALARAQEERNTGPTPVVDLALQGDERLGLGVVGDAGLVSVAKVLAAHDMGRFDRPHRSEDLVLLFADRSRFERRRWLHRHERQHLEQVRDDHVAIGTSRLVEAGARTEAERLGHVDLDVVDVIAVPDRFEQAVGEAEGEDVLCRLLAQEVVDAEDLLFVERLVHVGVELSSAGEIGTERLLHDDPRPIGEARLGERADDGTRRRGRHAQVVQPPRLATELALGLGHGGRESGSTAAATDVAKLAFERRPLLLGHGAAGELVAGDAGELAEAFVVEIVERGAHDPAVGYKTSSRQVQQAGQQLAPGQVAIGAEQHDDVGCQRRHQRSVDVARVCVHGHEDMLRWDRAEPHMALA